MINLANQQVSADFPELPPNGAAQRWEWLTVGLLSLAAAVHMAIFIAAFPFFNSVDKSVHFDLVVRYAHGRLPRRLDDFRGEAARLIGLYGSPEYFSFHEDLPGGKVGPPVWRYPAPQRDKVVREYTDMWQIRPNYESIQMPLYFVLDGTWYDLGKVLGLEGGQALLYWARFFTVPVCVVLVWLAYLLAKGAVAALPVRVSGRPFPAGVFSPGYLLRPEQ